MFSISGRLGRLHHARLESGFRAVGKGDVGGAIAPPPNPVPLHQILAKLDAKPSLKEPSIY